MQGLVGYAVMCFFDKFNNDMLLIPFQIGEIDFHMLRRYLDSYFYTTNWLPL